MNIETALSKAINILKNAQKISPAVDAGVILCFVLSCDRAYLLSHYNYELSRNEEEKYFNLINLRASGIPVQYITGHKEFMSLNFNVNPHVLIPRPETEILVETVLNYVGNYDCDKYVRILDMGTGSGCIAVSLAYYIENCRITAPDISEEALHTACLNAVANGVSDKITFVLSNLFEKLDGMVFDIIVSNPPYIPSPEIENLQIEVKGHEPIIALDGGEDGLYYYKKIVEEAPCFLESNGLLAFEVGYNQAREVARLMEERHFKKIKIIKDLAKIDRVVMGWY